MPPGPLVQAHKQPGGDRKSGRSRPAQNISRRWSLLRASCAGSPAASKSEQNGCRGATHFPGRWKGPATCDECKL